MGADKKRINLVVDAELYNKLQKIVKEYRFVDINEMGTAMLSLLCFRLEYCIPQRTENDREFIENIFNDYKSWERIPESEMPFVRHNNKDKYGKR